MLRRHARKLIIIAILICVGLLLEFAGLLDAEKMLQVARGYADQWWLVLVLILLQAVLFTFALAGSFFLWIAAPLYPPPMATFILAAGGTLGGIGAYWFSQRLTDDWIARIESSHTYRFLHKQDNFFTLFAMRVFPAFPHSLVNYSSGMLKVNLWSFIVAAILGISIKSYVYAQVIYGATTSSSLDELMQISTFGPLILISLLSLLGLLVKWKISQRKQS